MSGMAAIDLRIVNRLIAERLRTQVPSANVKISYQGEEPPEYVSARPWIQVVAVDAEQELQSAGSSGANTAPAQCSIVVSLSVFAPAEASRTDAYFIDYAIGECLKALTFVTLEDASTGTAVELDTGRVSFDQPDPLTRMRSAGVTITGLATRLSGVTLENILT